jgi:hypothetical protein
VGFCSGDESINIMKDKFNFWSKRFVPIHIILFFALLSCPTLFYTDYKPSLEVTKQAFIFGLVISACSLPFCIYTTFKLKGVLNNFLIIASPISFMILIALFGYSAVIGSFWFAANRIYGEDAVKSAIVDSKNDCRYTRKCICDTKIQLKADPAFVNGYLCIDKKLWHELQIGDDIRLRGIESPYGFEIMSYEKIDELKGAD